MWLLIGIVSTLTIVQLSKSEELSPQRATEAIKVKVDKLLKAGFIKEVDYLVWLSNMVLVKKTNKQWWVCVDFTDLNKTYPKDYFPLPKID